MPPGQRCDEVLPVVLAVGAAALYATSQASTRRSVELSKPTAVVLGTLSVSFLAMSAARLVARPSNLGTTGWTIVALLAAGVIAPGLGRLVNAVSLQGAGPLGTSPAQFVARPMIGLAGGLVFFGEHLTAIRLIAIACMVAGVLLLARGSVGGMAGGTRAVRRGLWIGAGAGAVYAVSEILRKAAIPDTDPITATWTTTGAALAFVLIGFAVIPRLRPGATRLPWRWVITAGLASALAQVLVFGALDVGDISVVAPVLAVQPLFVMVIAPLLRATGPLKVAAMWKSAVLATAGAVLMAVSG